MRWIKAGALILILLLTSIWGVCALYFGDSVKAWPQLVLAMLFALLGLATLISLAFARWRKYALIAYGTAFGLVLLYGLSIAPSNQRHWQTDASKLAYASFEGDSITVHNIR